MNGWRRAGRLDLDVSAAPWARSHAALPIVEAAGEDGAWTVYLSLRDGDGRARIGRTRLSVSPVPSLAPLEPEPVLDVGPLGAFDDSGVTGSCVVARDQRRYLYYTGWMRGVTVPFYLAAGLAVSEAGGAFERVSAAPLLDRTAVDPYLTASPWVLAERDRWRMWYISGTEWDTVGGAARHFYHVRYAESGDGIDWTREGRVCLDYREPGEHAFARPCVLRDADGRYRMWYAVRGDRYRIGYAESPDGLTWTRDDSRGLRPSGDGWDSDMVEYPCVFDAGGRRYMLYNGNDYGRSGVGMAIWDPTA